MDVHCSTCKEPWDTYTLQHEIIHDTDLSDDEIEEWKKLPFNEKLRSPYREKFKVLKWEFGDSVLNVIHCEACPEDAQPDLKDQARRAGIESVLGGDPDGLAAELQDL